MSIRDAIPELKLTTCPSGFYLAIRASYRTMRRFKYCLRTARRLLEKDHEPLFLCIRVSCSLPHSLSNFPHVILLTFLSMVPQFLSILFGLPLSYRRTCSFPFARDNLSNTVCTNLNYVQVRQSATTMRVRTISSTSTSKAPKFLPLSGSVPS